MRTRIRLPLLLAALVLGAVNAPAQQATDEEIEQMLAAPAPARGASTTVTGLSNQANPAIGVAGLLLGAGSDDGPANFGLQEIEISLSSHIDPFLRVDLVFAVEQEFDVAGLSHGGEEEGSEGGEAEPTMIIEQAVVTSTNLPSVTLRFGKFLLPFGKHNILHRDQFPFVTAPQVIQETLGGEGLNEMAIDAAPLLPLPFFSELNLTVLQGDSELFHFASESGGPDQAKYLAHSKNLLDITDDSTVEFGLSYLSGSNDAGGGKLTTVTGADLTFKHRPPFGRGLSALYLQAEFLASTREAGVELESGGYYLSAQWRALDYWWVQGRFGEITIDEEKDGAIVQEENKHTDFLIAWVLSEFSVLRLQLSQLELAGETVRAWYLQYNFATGAHPAHQY